jgi:hypothetical protein
VPSGGLGTSGVLIPLGTQGPLGFGDLWGFDESLPKGPETSGDLWGLGTSGDLGTSGGLGISGGPGISADLGTYCCPKISGGLGTSGSQGISDLEH